MASPKGKVEFPSGFGVFVVENIDWGEAAGGVGGGEGVQHGCDLGLGEVLRGKGSQEEGEGEEGGAWGKAGLEGGGRRG